MRSQFLIDDTDSTFARPHAKSIAISKANLSDKSYYSYMTTGVTNINYALMGMILILLIYIIFPNPIILALFAIMLFYIIGTFVLIIRYVTSRMPTDFNQPYAPREMPPM
jgi:hypothetical protein